jgi:hypothetical protein
MCVNSSRSETGSPSGSRSAHHGGLVWRCVLGWLAIARRREAAIKVLFLRPHRWASALLGMALFWAAEAFAAWAALAALGVNMSVAALVVGFGTGMVFTRRTGPLGGAGVLVLVLPPALWYSGAPFAAAVAGVFIYQVLFLWLPMPPALTLLLTLRAMGEQRGHLNLHPEAGVTGDHRRQARRPGQPAPAAAPHRALGIAGLRWPGRASGERRRRSHAQRTDQGREDLPGTPRPRGKQGKGRPDRECRGRHLSQPGGRKGGKSGSYDDWAKPDLLRRAREIGIKGRSTMTKAELIKALRNH